ncbi:hypothetical protein HDU93_009065, partial [Gonapodya sp. JEL0774]
KAVVDDVIAAAKTRFSPTLDKYGVQQLLLKLTKHAKPLPGSLPVRKLVGEYGHVTEDRPLILELGTKTIFVEQFDSNGELIGFPAFRVATDEDIRAIGAVLEFTVFFPHSCSLSQGTNGYAHLATAGGDRGALVRLGDAESAIRNVDDVDDGSVYTILNSDLSSITPLRRYVQRDSLALEDKTRAAVAAYLSRGGVWPKMVRELPRKLHDKNGRPMQEWDWVFFDEIKNALCLLKTKHVMEENHLKTLLERAMTFKKTAELSAERNTFVPYLQQSSVRLIAAAALFLVPLRNVAKEMGIIVVFPSGSRFGVADQDHWVVETE